MNTDLARHDIKIVLEASTSAQICDISLDLSPEGRPGIFDVSHLSRISGLSFDSTLLSPVLFFSAQSQYCFCLVFFSASWLIPLNFFLKNSSVFFSFRDRLFCVAPVQQLAEVNWSVVCAACCHMALVGICCCEFMFLLLLFVCFFVVVFQFLFDCFCSFLFHSFFYIFKKYNLVIWY